MRPTPAKTLIALRQLALLDHSGSFAIPEAVGLLRAQIGFNVATMKWLDKHINIIDVMHFPDNVPTFSPNPIDYRAMSTEHLTVAFDYFENFHNRLDGEGMSGCTIRNAQASGAIVVAAPSREIFRREYVNSAFYARVIIPLGYGWNRLLPIRRSDRSPLAILHIGRLLNTPDFNASDVRFLEQAQPWLEHLMRRDALPASSEPHFPTGESVNMIIDAQGRILSASLGALALLYQATDVPLKNGSILHNTIQGKVDTFLKRLAKPAEAALNGCPALPPEAQINNRWGRFYLRAYVLSAFTTGSPLQISLHIERHVPLSVRLFRSLRFLALSPREREVCLHLLAERTHPEIAIKMGVKISTVVYFIRQLYQRLGINRLAELLPALLLPDPA